ncbi:unnamed protein product [Caenorhabditis bovis]|uniref:Uncharacterized protein n=1 Tax=Caenorhabditis bovis TaxID=2654633 RepID=A0A8S1ELK0_9PELO|nr:unnamed protein product [Caenorhabditis bovis]
METRFLERASPSISLHIALMNSSIFDFKGSSKRILFRVKLYQKGVPALDFERFAQSDASVFDETPINSKIDETTFEWLQNDETASNNNNNGTHRLFTVTSVDELPDHLKKYWKVGTPWTLPENREKHEIFPSDEHLVFRKNSGVQTATKKSLMFLLARLGSLELQYTSIPEAENFAVAPDGFIHTAVNVTLLDGDEFLFDDGLIIDYKLRLPQGVRLVTDNRMGRTRKFSADENHRLHFGEHIELVFEHSSAINEHPLLMLRIFTIDYWGRQHIAGYGSLFISMQPGTHHTTVFCWRPTSKNSLYEYFVGQAIDVDYFGIQENSTLSRVGVDSQSSGQINIAYSCVSQCRQFMANDVLYQLKYGTKMAQMGLRSDFYQRIIKVLMEFEEARAKLLQARALAAKSLEYGDRLTILPTGQIVVHCTPTTRRKASRNAKNCLYRVRCNSVH